MEQDQYKTYGHWGMFKLPELPRLPVEQIKGFRFWRDEYHKALMQDKKHLVSEDA